MIRPLMKTLLFIALTAAFAWGVWSIMQTPPPAKKARAGDSTPLVEVLPVEAGEHALRLFAYGRVEAHDPLDLRPQVEGRILALHPAFEAGGLIRAGEELVRLDDADHRLALAAARSALEKAEAQLAIEGGRRQVAKEELRLLADSLSLDKGSRSLALRAPQLREARADVLAARNAVEMAQLQLDRTRITLPQDVIVLQRERSQGELVHKGERIGRLASAALVQITLQIAPRLVERLNAATGDAPGHRVTIEHRGKRYQGQVKRLQQALSERTRQAALLVEIEDPFNLKADHLDRPPLLIGTYVEAWVDAGRLPNSIIIPRAQLSDNRHVWVVDADQRLQVRSVQPLFEEPDRIFTAPLPDGDRLLRGNAGGLLPGTRVRTR